MAESETQWLLVEIGTEELPPENLEELGKAFFAALCEQLRAVNLEFNIADSRWFATPRRLAVTVAELAPRQPDSNTTRRGPAVNIAFDDDGEPSKAAIGFARSVGTSVYELEREKTGQGEYLVHRSREPGQTLDQLLPDAITTALSQLPAPRRMRWGANTFDFVRPVHWQVVLYGDRVIPFEAFGIHSGRDTRGHRFHSSEPVSIAKPEDYEQALRNAFVISEFSRRREAIREQVHALAGAGKVALSDELLDEITALTEWPASLLCAFDASFLQLPAEVIITTLQHEQRFIPILDNNGDLTARYIAVANIDSKKPDVVREGFERVVRPRLADAEFLYQQDLETPLAKRRDDLKGVLFQQRCGTLFDKAERIAVIAKTMAAALNLDAGELERAARLAKCDLTTHMVTEFPALQGVMGRYYALHDGETESVADAIEAHYRPRFANDEIPAAPIGRLVGLADKLDTVCVVIAAAGRPTGNKDPFGLRRQAVGALRILIEGELDLDLKELIATTSTLLPVDLSAEQQVEVLTFLLERLAGYYRDQNVSPDVLASVSALGITRPLDFDRRIHAVRAFCAMPEAASLAAANKRVRNILKQAEKGASARVDVTRFEHNAEHNLYAAIAQQENELEPLIAQSSYQAALAGLAGLKQPLDTFFDDVMVMADDDTLRRNRIALLSRVRAMFLSIADISRLELKDA